MFNLYVNDEIIECDNFVFGISFVVGFVVFVIVFSGVSSGLFVLIL